MADDIFLKPVLLSVNTSPTALHSTLILLFTNTFNRLIIFSINFGFRVNFVGVVLLEYCSFS